MAACRVTYHEASYSVRSISTVLTPIHYLWSKIKNGAPVVKGIHNLIPMRGKQIAFEQTLKIGFFAVQHGGNSNSTRAHSCVSVTRTLSSKTQNSKLQQHQSGKRIIGVKTISFFSLLKCQSVRVILKCLFSTHTNLFIGCEENITTFFHNSGGNFRFTVARGVKREMYPPHYKFTNGEKYDGSCSGADRKKGCIGCVYERRGGMRNGPVTETKYLTQLFRLDQLGMVGGNEADPRFHLGQTQPNV